MLSYLIQIYEFIFELNLNSFYIEKLKLKTKFMKTLYTAKTTAKGGRAGSIKTDDGILDMDLSVPEGMGGKGGNGTNPEQLFGGAYAACFGGALQAVAGDLDLGGFSVTASVSFNAEAANEFVLSVILDAYLPTLSIEKGEELVNKAHEICPFSKATRDNIDVTLNLLVDEA